MTSPQPASTTTVSHSPEGYRADIEGLRGIAVLMVVAYHAALPGITGGFVGVDVFFVLSGYLITGILTRTIESTGKLDILRFYARRVLRLLPAATLMLVTVLLASRFLLGPLEQIDPTQSGIAVALYSSNVFFMFRATDYFAPTSELAPLLHTWSLAVEEQFYLFWPVLVLIGMRVGKSRRGLAWLLGVFTLLSLVGCIWLTHKRQPWAFFGTPARAWEFGIGGVASLLSAAAIARLRPLGKLIGWTGLVATIGAAFVIDGTTVFPGYAALLPAIGTTLALIGGTIGAGSASAIMESSLLQWIGKRSYSWYLWHWPVIVFARAFNLAETWYVRSAWMLLALLIATITTALVENPIRFSKALRTRSTRTLVLGSACTACAATFAFVLNRGAQSEGGNLHLAATQLSQLTLHECETDFPESLPRECSFGDTASKQVAILFGDSHAGQWFPALDAIAKRNHVRLITEVKYSCPVARVLLYNGILHHDYIECSDWRDAVLRRLQKLKPALVIVAQSSRSGEKPSVQNGVHDSLTYAEWSAGFRSTLASLDSMGFPVVIFRDNPRLSIPVPQCLSRAVKRHTDMAQCGRDRASVIDDQTFLAEQEAARGFAKTAFMDFSDEFCSATRCEPMSKGLVVYRDGGHISVQFAEHLTDAIERQLLPHLNYAARP